MGNYIQNAPDMHLLALQSVGIGFLIVILLAILLWMVRRRSGITRPLDRSSPHLDARIAHNGNRTRDALKRWQGRITCFWISALIAFLANDLQPWLIVALRPLVSITLQIALVAYIIGLVVIQRQLRSRVYWFKVLVLWALFGAIGCIIFAAIIIYNIDIHLDPTSGTQFEQLIVDKHMVHGKHTRYAIAVRDWHGKGIYTLNDVKYSAYSQAQPGYTLRILTHPGYLGAEWIERYEVIPK